MTTEGLPSRMGEEIRVAVPVSGHLFQQPQTTAVEPPSVLQQQGVSFLPTRDPICTLEEPSHR